MKNLIKTTVLMLMTITNTQADDTAITVYSTAAAGSISPAQFQNQQANVPGYAMIKQDRMINIQKGQFELRFSDVTSQIDPTTVSFSTPNNPGAAFVFRASSVSISLSRFRLFCVSPVCLCLFSDSSHVLVQFIWPILVCWA